MKFNLRPQSFAPTQRAIIALLDRSPLPWTRDMLEDWFPQNIGAQLQAATWKRRIWRCELGIYTSIRHHDQRPTVVVTDEMLGRYGFNL